MVWQSFGSFGSDVGQFTSIQGQRYESSGGTVGSQFQVNTYTTSTQQLPSVAADAGGDFVVVWESGGSSGSDNSASSIQGQRYGALPLLPSLSPAGFAAAALLMLLAVGAVLQRGLTPRFRQGPFMAEGARP